MAGIISSFDNKEYRKYLYLVGISLPLPILYEIVFSVLRVFAENLESDCYNKLNKISEFLNCTPYFLVVNFYESGKGYVVFLTWALALYFAVKSWIVFYKLEKKRLNKS